MAATCDGLFVGTILWAVVFSSLTFWPQHIYSYVHGAAAVVVLALCATACYREAGRYVEYQIEELVAAIATEKSRH
jgi:hypothetical protein